MSNFIKIAQIEQMPSGTSKICLVQGRSIALFQIAGTFYAIDNTCPHRGGKLGEGKLEGTVVTCPLHGWRFDVATGGCLTHSSEKVTSHRVEVQGDDVLLEVLEPAAPHKHDDQRQQFLVRFGAMGYVGRFEATEQVSCSRGSRLVVRTSRGVEAGELLATGQDGTLLDGQPLAGQVLREFTSEDALLERALREGQQRAFESCRQLLVENQIAVELVDAEQLLDGETIIFYFLGDATPALADVNAELASQYESRIEFRQFMERVEAGCGPGCGTDAAGHVCTQCHTEDQPDTPGACATCQGAR